MGEDDVSSYQVYKCLMPFLPILASHVFILMSAAQRDNCVVSSVSVFCQFNLPISIEGRSKGPETLVQR